MPCRCQFQSEKSILLCYPLTHEKLQLIKRLPAPLIRHVLACYRSEQLSAPAAAAELGISFSRFFTLFSDYLRACAQGHADLWSPGISGGNHRPVWPEAVTALLTK